MSELSSYILSAYSFIKELPLDELFNVGNQMKNGIPIPSFDEDLLIDLCSEAQEIFKSENNILRIEGDVMVVGDIHGSFHDLLRILKFIDKKQSKVLFLGDYVDRGQFSLECISILFAMKIYRPNTFFLIRGNHEFDSLCSQYGFKKEILNYYHHKIVNSGINETNLSSDDETISNNSENSKNDENISNYKNTNCYRYTKKLYDAFIDAFSYLPVCAVVNNTSFCIHGGLSPLLEKIDFIQTCIKRPITTYEENILFSDFVWSDPSTNILISFRSNHRGRGFLFDGNATNDFLTMNSLQRIVRAHQCVKNGIYEQFNKKCITVFSASSYSFDNSNHSGILQLIQSDDSVQYFMFPPLPRLNKNDSIYYKVHPFKTVGSKKSIYFSMRHPKLVFKGNTTKTNKDKTKNKAINANKSQRDFHSLKIHCHVNPASIAHNRKSNFPFIHVPSDYNSFSKSVDQKKSPHQRIVSKSGSLPTKLLYSETVQFNNNDNDIINDDSNLLEEANSD